MCRGKLQEGIDWSVMIVVPASSPNYDALPRDHFLSCVLDVNANQRLYSHILVLGCISLIGKPFLFFLAFLSLCCPVFFLSNEFVVLLLMLSLFFFFLFSTSCVNDASL